MIDLGTLASIAERTGGRYCVYRWHADNPVTFNTYMRHTIEHGHANDRADNFYSVGYWYQTEPATDFPPLPPVASRWPAFKSDLDLSSAPYTAAVGETLLLQEFLLLFASPSQFASAHSRAS